MPFNFKKWDRIDPDKRLSILNDDISWSNVKRSHITSLSLIKQKKNYDDFTHSFYFIINDIKNYSNSNRLLLTLWKLKKSEGNVLSVYVDKYKGSNSKYRLVFYQREDGENVFVSVSGELNVLYRYNVTIIKKENRLNVKLFWEEGKVFDSGEMIGVNHTYNEIILAQSHGFSVEPNCESSGKIYNLNLMDESLSRFAPFTEEQERLIIESVNHAKELVLVHFENRNKTVNRLGRKYLDMERSSIHESMNLIIELIQTKRYDELSDNPSAIEKSNDIIASALSVYYYDLKDTSQQIESEQLMKEIDEIQILLAMDRFEKSENGLYQNYILKVIGPQRKITEAIDYEYDLFICHASEDKQSFVDDLVNELRRVGLNVWYDTFVLILGDKLRRKIDQGLLSSRYGVVVLSKNFFDKEWPQAELDGLASMEKNNRKVILPIWHGVGEEDVRKFSPILSGCLAARTEKGIDHVVHEILKVFKNG